MIKVKRAEPTRLIDAHTHVQPEEIDFLARNGIRCIINGGSPQEWKRNKAILLEYPSMLASYGIHPWYADRYDVAELEDYMPRIIGEIGMDSVWCGVDLAIQRRCFCLQLQLAARLGASVILHTKGQEKEILDIIRQYPLAYMVHWYDDIDYLSGYMELGCFFSVPINLTANIIAQQIVRKAPLERLLLESDGIEAVAWALDKPVTQREYLEIMTGNTEYIARAKGLSVESVQSQFEANLEEFAGSL